MLGHDIGERFTPHHKITRYLERLAATSRRISVDTLGHTFEGREVLLAVVTSDANRARLEQIRADLAWLADGRAPAGEVAAAAARVPAVAWLGYTVHGGEASGTEAALALLYQLAAGQDAETRTIVDSTVVLIDPVQNPDGHERHVQDVMRLLGTRGVPTSPGAMIHQGNWPGPRTSHYYFDLNRDWFIHSHPETRARVRGFLRWMPHVAVDLHEMGSNSTYFFAPPMEPVNKNVHPSILKWWDVYAAANAAAFDAQGWPYFRREGYDEFYPGYGVSWPILTGAVGMTYEQASSGGGAIRRDDGTVLTLRDAASHHYAAAWATLLTTARRARERVRDYAEFRRSAVADAQRSAERAMVFERDGQGRADSLVALLQRNGIEVRAARRGTAFADGAEYGGRPASGAAARPAAAGDVYVVDFAQPQGRLARALLEPDAVLDSSFIAQELESRRTAQPERFYDITAWSLPYAYRLRAWTVRTLPAGVGGPVERVDDTTRVAGAPAAAPTRARHAYVFAPGSESAIRTAAALLADSVRMWFAPRSFSSAGASFPNGAFVVRVAANDSSVHERVRRHAAANGLAVTALASAMVEQGTDLGSNSVYPIRMPRVALVGRAPVQGNSFGFSWFALEQRIGYPVTPIDASTLGGPVLDDFNVLVVPSLQAAAFDRVLGDAGRDRLAQWVRAGGVLIAIDGASAWLAGERLGLARVRLRRDSTRADSAGGAPLPADVPGAIVRALGDSLSPLMAGVSEREFPVPASGDRALVVPRDLRAGEAVVRFAPRERLRLAGYLWPESPARLAGSPFVWTERVGRGRVIAFNGDPNFRDLWRGLLPLFANAVLLGGSF